MSKNRFVGELQVEDLTQGTAVALWGFRVCAAAAPGCRCVTRGFGALFGADDGERVRGLVEALVESLVRFGKRQVWMAVPATIEVTHDEVCVMRALRAAQQDDLDGLEAQLLWLLAGRVPDEVVNHFIATGAMLYSHGFEVVPPKQGLPLPAPTAAKDERSSSRFRESFHASHAPSVPAGVDG